MDISVQRHDLSGMCLYRPCPLTGEGQTSKRIWLTVLDPYLKFPLPSIKCGFGAIYKENHTQSHDKMQLPPGKVALYKITNNSTTNIPSPPAYSLFNATMAKKKRSGFHFRLNTFDETSTENVSHYP
jgi:hypothetical protein